MINYLIKNATFVLIFGYRLKMALSTLHFNHSISQ